MMRLLYFLFGARACVLATIPRDLARTTWRYFRAWLNRVEYPVSEQERFSRQMRRAYGRRCVRRQPLGFGHWQSTGLMLPIGGGAEDPAIPPTSTPGVGYAEDINTVLGRVRSRVVDVRDHGAIGNGVADDTAAIQAALAAAGALVKTTTPTGSGQVAAVPTVLLVPGGHHKISAALTYLTAGLSYTRLVGSQTILEQTDAGEDILDLRGTVRHDVEGVIFVGGARHVFWGNNNVNASQLFFDRCEFHNSADWAIETTLTGTWGTVGNLSANVTLSRCRIQNVNRVLKNVEGCEARVEASWVQVESATMVDGAIFQNRNVLTFDRMYGTPPQSATPTNAHWIDNYGQFYARDSRFGGEGAGMFIVDNFAGPQTVSPYNLGGVVAIRDSFCAIGPDGGARPKALIRLNTAVPQLIDVRGNYGIQRASEPWILDAISGGGAAAYIAANFTGNVFGYINVEGNIGHQPIDSSGVPAALYNAPLRYRWNWTPAQRAIGSTVGPETGYTFVNNAGGTQREARLIYGQVGVSNSRITLEDVTNGRLLTQWLDDASTADGFTCFSVRRNVGGTFTIQPVSMGATDSGGSGFKVLRVPN